MKLDLTKTNGSSPPTNHQPNTDVMNLPLYPEQEIDGDKERHDQNRARIMSAVPERPEHLRIIAELLLRVRQYFSLLPQEICKRARIAVLTGDQQ